MAFWQWSRTAATNATADATINWQEGMPPAAVNDSGRAMMARLADWRQDISGTITTAGTSTAFTVTSNQTFDSFAHMDGAMIAFIPHATNGGTSTLNVDGLGVKPLRSSPGVELVSGTIIQGTPYAVTYVNADNAFYMQSFFANAFNIPIGGLMPYLGASAPNSSFVIPIGQAISRTTFATLFSLVSTTFGVGDGSTTFNVPDLRGRTIFQLDSGGSGRITVAGGNFDGTVLGGTGGGQNKVISAANVPQLSFTGTQQTWALNQTNVLLNGGGANNLPTGGIVSVANTPNVTITPAGTVNTGSANTALPLMPPSMVLPYILRVI